MQGKTSSSEEVFLSGWQDSNLRPPRPKRGAITGLRYTPKTGANIKLFILTTNTNFYINFKPCQLKKSKH